MNTDVFPTVSSQYLSKVKTVLAKKQRQHELDKYQEDYGPLAEFRSNNLHTKVEVIRVADILEDKNFTNFRSSIDPVKLSELQGSIELEGLRVPIVVVATMPEGHYYMRAGFRRIMAVRNLGWSEVSAVVLPWDMPKSEEYWTNILENTAREKLSAYELANAAQMMRDKFQVSGNDFAKKSGHSPEYIRQLLSCMDKLPGEVRESWRRGDRVPFSIYFQLSTMTPLEAIKNLRLWMGQHRIETVVTKAEDALRKLRSRHHTTDKLLTVRGIERTQRLLMAIKVSKLTDKEKELGKEIVEYVQGCRRRVNGILNDRQHVPEEDFTIPRLDAVELGVGAAPLSESNEMDDLRRKLEQTFRELENVNLPENLKT